MLKSECRASVEFQEANPFPCSDDFYSQFSSRLIKILAFFLMRKNLIDEDIIVESLIMLNRHVQVCAMFCCFWAYLRVLGISSCL